MGYTQLQNLALSTPLPMLVLITIKHLDFAVGIAVPRNGNLLANVLLGKLLLWRHYGPQQLLAILLLSAGVDSLIGAVL